MAQTWLICTEAQVQSQTEMLARDPPKAVLLLGPQPMEPHCHPHGHSLSFAPKGIWKMGTRLLNPAYLLAPGARAVTESVRARWRPV